MAAPETALLECDPALREQCVEAPVHVKHGREFHEPHDLAGGEIVVESVPQQQPVARRQLAKGDVERLEDFRAFEDGGGVRVRGRKLRLDRRRNEIGQPAPHTLLLQCLRILRPCPPVFVPVVIETEPSRDHREPRLERTSAGDPVRKQASAVIFAKLAQRVRVRVHRGVVVAGNCACNLQQPRREGGDKTIPSPFTLGVVGRSHRRNVRRCLTRGII